MYSTPKQITGELSGGQQRMVEIGRTLMADPKMMLIDEPTAGLSKMLAEEVYAMLTDLLNRVRSDSSSNKILKCKR